MRRKGSGNLHGFVRETELRGGPRRLMSNGGTGGGAELSLIGRVGRERTAVADV